MKKLREAKVLFLDDEPKYLERTTNLFNSQNIALTTSTNPHETIMYAESGRFDIALSDFDLRRIKSQENGVTVLEKIRRHDNDILLGLFTAYEKLLTKEQKVVLATNNIKVYRKDDPKAFLENLAEDYKDFQITLNRTNSRLEYNHTLMEVVPGTLDFFNKVTSDVLKHLKGISNQNIFIQIPSANNNAPIEISVKKLIKEVIEKTDTGKRYMLDWYDSLLFINNLINNPK